MLLALARCFWVLSFLLLLGACQRSGYSFQPASPAALRTLPLVAADTLWAATLPRPPAAPHEGRVTHRRPRAAAPAAATLATPAQAPHKLLRRLAAMRAISAPARQQPLPPGEPVRYRSRGLALLLAAVPLLFGLPLGLYHFYLGYPGRGALTIGLLVAGIVLLTIGLIGFLGAIFGGGSGFVGFYVAGAIILSFLYLVQLIDIVRIAVGNLKPTDGEYYPRFFQSRPEANAPPSR